MVGRGFVDAPRPSRIERLCDDCLVAHVEEFVGQEFEAHGWEAAGEKRAERD